MGQPTHTPLYSPFKRSREDSANSTFNGRHNSPYIRINQSMVSMGDTSRTFSELGSRSFNTSSAPSGDLANWMRDLKQRAKRIRTEDEKESKKFHEEIETQRRQIQEEPRINTAAFGRLGEFLEQQRSSQAIQSSIPSEKLQESELSEEEEEDDDDDDDGGDLFIEEGEQTPVIDVLDDDMNQYPEEVEEGAYEALQTIEQKVVETLANVESFARSLTGFPEQATNMERPPSHEDVSNEEDDDIVEVVSIGSESEEEEQVQQPVSSHLSQGYMNSQRYGYQHGPSMINNNYRMNPYSYGNVQVGEEDEDEEISEEDIEGEEEEGEEEDEDEEEDEEEEEEDHNNQQRYQANYMNPPYGSHPQQAQRYTYGGKTVKSATAYQQMQYGSMKADEDSSDSISEEEEEEELEEVEVAIDDHLDNNGKEVEIDDEEDLDDEEENEEEEEEENVEVDNDSDLEMIVDDEDVDIVNEEGEIEAHPLPHGENVIGADNDNIASQEDGSGSALESDSIEEEEEDDEENENAEEDNEDAEEYDDGKSWEGFSYSDPASALSQVAELALQNIHELTDAAAQDNIHEAPDHDISMVLDEHTEDLQYPSIVNGNEIEDFVESEEEEILQEIHMEDANIVKQICARDFLNEPFITASQELVSEHDEVASFNEVLSSDHSQAVGETIPPSSYEADKIIEAEELSDPEEDDEENEDEGDDDEYEHIGKHIEEPEEVPEEAPGEEHIEKTIEAHIEEPVGESIEEHIEQSVEEPVEELVEEPIVEAIEELEETPEQKHNQEEVHNEGVQIPIQTETNDMNSLNTNVTEPNDAILEIISSSEVAMDRTPYDKVKVTLDLPAALPAASDNHLVIPIHIPQETIVEDHDESSIADETQFVSALNIEVQQEESDASEEDISDETSMTHTNTHQLLTNEIFNDSAVPELEENCPPIELANQALVEVNTANLEEQEAEVHQEEKLENFQQNDLFDVDLASEVSVNMDAPLPEPFNIQPSPELLPKPIVDSDIILDFNNINSLVTSEANFESLPSEEPEQNSQMEVDMDKNFESETSFMQITSCNTDTDHVITGFNDVSVERPIQEIRDEVDAPITSAHIDAEPMDTEPVKAEISEPIHVAPVEAEMLDAEPVDVEPLASEPIDTEHIDTEPMGTGPLDTELLDTEPTNTPPVHAETYATESIDTEAIATEAITIESLATESLDTEYISVVMDAVTNVTSSVSKHEESLDHPTEEIKDFINETDSNVKEDYPDENKADDGNDAEIVSKVENIVEEAEAISSPVALDQSVSELEEEHDIIEKDIMPTMDEEVAEADVPSKEIYLLESEKNETEPSLEVTSNQDEENSEAQDVGTNNSVPPMESIEETLGIDIHDQNIAADGQFLGAESEDSARSSLDVDIGMDADLVNIDPSSVEPIENIPTGYSDTIDEVDTASKTPTSKKRTAEAVDEGSFLVKRLKKFVSGFVPGILWRKIRDQSENDFDNANDVSCKIVEETTYDFNYSNEVNSDEIDSAEVDLGTVDSTEIASGEVDSGTADSVDVESGAVESGEVEYPLESDEIKGNIDLTPSVSATPVTPAVRFFEELFKHDSEAETEPGTPVPILRSSEYDIEGDNEESQPGNDKMAKNVPKPRFMPKQLHMLNGLDYSHAFNTPSRRTRSGHKIGSILPSDFISEMEENDVESQDTGVSTQDTLQYDDKRITRSSTRGLDNTLLEPPQENSEGNETTLARTSPRKRNLSPSKNKSLQSSPNKRGRTSHVSDNRQTNKRGTSKSTRLSKSATRSRERASSHVSGRGNTLGDYVDTSEHISMRTRSGKVLGAFDKETLEKFEKSERIQNELIEKLSSGAIAAPQELTNLTRDFQQQEELYLKREKKKMLMKQEQEEENR